MRRGRRRGGRGGPPLASRPLGLGFDLRVLRTSGLGRPRASRRPARARGRAARSSHNHLTTFAWLARAPTPAKDIARKLGACMQCGAHQPVSRDATGGSARAEWAARRLVVVAQLYKLLVATVADTRDISCAGLRGACMLPSGARARARTRTSVLHLAFRRTSLPLMTTLSSSFSKRFLNLRRASSSSHRGSARAY